MGAGESKLATAVENGNLVGVKEALKAGEDVDCNNRGDYTPLHKAAEAGYHNIAVALIEAKANVHAKDKRIVTLRYEPLHFAAENGHKDIALLLICTGASVSSRTANGDEAIHLSIKRNHLCIVVILISAGADLSTPDKAGKLPIQLAVAKGHLQIVQSLVKANVDVSAKDNKGEYPIHLAIRNNHLNIVSALISAGADVSVKNGSGQTPLHMAVEKGNALIVQALVDASADISAKDDVGNQVHHMAATEGYTKIMDILLSSGADVEDLDTEGNQALHLASKKGYHAVVSSLLSAGASFSIPDRHGYTAAHIAASNGYTEVLKVLKKHGDDFKCFSSNSRKYTPLHSATESGQMNTVQWLVRNGASLKSYSALHMTAADLAKVNFHQSICSWFEHVKDQHKNVLEYAKKGDFHSVMAALDVGATASKELLHLAVLAGKVRVVQAALSVGTGIEDSSFFFRYRPLHHAAERGHSQVVQELLKAGADHTAVEYRGRAAIHIAASSGHESVLKVMKAHGCDLHLTSSNRYKWTPLHYAAWEGHLMCVKWLVLNGADIKCKGNDGSTPAICADKRQHKDVVWWLQSDCKHPSDKNENKSASSGDDKTADQTILKDSEVKQKMAANGINQECGDCDIPEICYSSVEGICSSKAEGCKRVHASRHYHWQVKEPFGPWLNLPEKQVNCLENAFCDPSKDAISLPLLNEKEEMEFTPNTLVEIMGKDSWCSSFQDMTVTDPSNRRILKLRRLCSEVINGKPIKPSLNTWYFLDKNEKWVKYGNVDTSGNNKLVCNITPSDIEKFYVKDPKQSISFQNSQFRYILDFETMSQMNTETKVCREVRRRPEPHAVKQHKECIKESPSVNLGFPAHWEIMESGECLRKVELSPNTKEFQDICISLQATANASSVEKIERVQNPFLWFAFQNKVREMTAIYGVDCNVSVCQLFHGTNASVIDKICTENFDWRLHGTSTGQMFGRGTYFSPNSKTAYAYCKCDSYGRYYLFLAQVAVGTYAVGDPSMVTPPLNPNTKKMYNSTVDSITNPNIIVKYDKQEYYPEYIVTINHNPFTRRKNVNANPNANCTIS